MSGKASDGVASSETRELRDSVVPSNRRPLGRGDASGLDAAVLASLLDLALTLPLDADPRELARRTLERVQGIAPDCALGACIAGGDSGEQIVELRLPAGVARDAGRDPTRLFPGLAAERIIALGDKHGSTFHVAGNDVSLEKDGSPLATLADRAAAVLADSLESARRYRTARGGSADQVNRLKEQLIQAEKLSSLGQIVAGVVHELNNPLTSIVAYSDYLAKKAQNEGGDLEDIERLRRIGEAAERILKFARDLIAYARPSNEIPGPVEVHEVIDKALLFCEHEFSDANVEVHRTFVDPEIRVRGVSGQLTQVFVNLFTNASHAMAERGGGIIVRTEIETERDALRIDVTDNGSGIPQEVLGRIFEPFFSTKPDGRGTGLGLSIVRDIVSAHGGNLSAASTPGEGTTFTVVLPLAAAPDSTD